MKVTNCKAPDNFTPNDGFDGWQRIVAGVVIGAAEIGTLWLTHSMEHTTAVALLVLAGLGVTLRK